MICDNLNINNKGHLTFAGFDTVELAQNFGTPAYIMDEAKIRENCRMYKENMQKYFGIGSTPVYASKACSFKYIYKIMRDENMFIDIVSPGEMHTVKAAGFPLENAFFHGNNKTDADIEYGIECGVGYFIADNREEIDALERIAGEKNINQKILLRITPGIDPHTHKAVITGNVDSKFGSAIETQQAMELVKYILEKQNITLLGFHCHIGSQIFEADPFCEAAGIMLDFIAEVKAETGFEAEYLNLGGGFGVRYLEEHPIQNHPAKIKLLSECVKRKCGEHSIKTPKILLEPGRSIVADSGLTLYTVGSVKTITGYKSYVSIDGGMPDNPRYALYQSPYTCVIANKAAEQKSEKYTVAGRCCESGDLIQEDAELQKARRGDILAVLTTGAYNYSMASNYNRIPRPPVIMLRNGEAVVAVQRESFDDLIKNDIL